MDDGSRQPAVEPPLHHVDGGGDAFAPAHRAPDTRPASQTIAQKLAERPVTTAAICILLGAFAAESIALLFARARARNALERSALRNLRLAQGLDPRGDPLI